MPRSRSSVTGRALSRSRSPTHTFNTSFTGARYASRAPSGETWGLVFVGLPKSTARGINGGCASVIAASCAPPPWGEGGGKMDQRHRDRLRGVLRPRQPPVGQDPDRAFGGAEPVVIAQARLDERLRDVEPFVEHQAHDFKRVLERRR